ncbi:MAG: radical SAM protein [candidate division Zixibacteria bacterium]|nr:radical SAM protein [candidate division Zixibacteria bacterium]
MEENKRKCLPLKNGVIYGPVHSRRLGESLGINVSPTKRKICSFNCVYCHYGWSKKVTLDTEKYADEFPTPEVICSGLEENLKNNLKPDYITFSGNGEPTTHPKFPEIVKGVISLRDELVPDVKVTILSNSTTANNAEILLALEMLDIRFMKLDCGEESTYKRFNRPAANVTLNGIIESLINMQIPIILQSMIADGEGGNYAPKSIDGYIDAVGKIKPESIQLYSLDRPTPDGTLRGLTEEQLNDLAGRITSKTQIPVEIFGRRSENRNN